MAKARKPRMRAIVVLIAGLLAAAVVWAGTALGGGSGDGAKPTPAAPTQNQNGSGHDGKRVSDRDCPKDRAQHSSIDL
jgi:hypothetical protein